jgi:hypothetical protein
MEQRKEEGFRNTITNLKKQIAIIQKERDDFKSKLDGTSKEQEYHNLVIIGNDWKPHCEKHGAMIKTDADPVRIYRCIECNVGVDLTQVHKYIRLTYFGGERE